MKKLTLLLLLSLSHFTTGFAQWSSGIKAGLNLSTIHSSEDLVSGYLPGFNAGLYFNYKMNDVIEFQPEVLYSKQGYKWDMLVCDVNGNLLEKKVTKYRTHNIIIPVLVKINMFKRMSIDFGPQTGIYLGKHSSGKPLWNLPKSKPVDFGIVAGIGYMLSDRVWMTGRYYVGLTHSLKSKLLDIEDKYGTENRVIQLSLTYRLF